MPITVAYDPAIALAGELAYESGRGQFLQQQDRYEYDQERADRDYDLRERAFSEGQRQFDVQQQYNADLAMLKDQQFRQQLGQQAYQFDTGIESREQLAQLQAAAQLESQQLRQQGLAEYQANQAELQREAMEGREQLQLKGRLGRLQQLHVEQLGKAGLSAAAEIQDFPFRRPEQKQQAIDQWLRQYGEMFGGQFPSFTPFSQPAEALTVENAGEQLQQVFGDMYRPGIENLFGTVVDGEYVPDEKMRPAAEAWLSLQRAQITAETQREKAHAGQPSTEQVEAERAAATVDAYHSWLDAREAWVDKQLAARAGELAAEPISLGDLLGDKSGDNSGDKSKVKGDKPAPPKTPEQKRVEMIDQLRREYLARFSHALPSPTSQAEYNALPPGALYRDSRGIHRTKGQ